MTQVTFSVDGSQLRRLERPMCCSNFLTLVAVHEGREVEVHVRFLREKIHTMPDEPARPATHDEAATLFAALAHRCMVAEVEQKGAVHE